LERKAAISHPGMAETYGCPLDNSAKIENTHVFKVQTYSSIPHSSYIICVASTQRGVTPTT